MDGSVMSINRTWQRKLLAEAARTGTLHTLYWYPVAVNGRQDKGIAVGAVEPSIPVVPVGRDPEESRHEAHLMIELLELPGAAFALELTTADLLNECGVPWFEWGSHDHICPGCGAIGNDCICTAIRTCHEPLCTPTP
jgi:hypothetical protein